MTIRKILNGKLVEMGPIPTGYKCDVCKTCALVNEKSQCMTPDDTCMEYPDENWHLVEENSPSTEVEGRKYYGVPKTYPQDGCEDCASFLNEELCEPLRNLNLCDNRYFVEVENTQENNQ